MLSIQKVYSARQLSGSWTVYPLPLKPGTPAVNLASDDALQVPQAVHLQPFLFPDNPYWGEHLRAINDHAWIYHRAFLTPDAPFKRVRLRFDGVDYFAQVWLNGQFVGQHEGHFNPFSFDITDIIRSTGDLNDLVVRVSAPWDKPNPGGSYPTDHVIRGLVKGLYEHGEGVIPPNVNPIGIWRPVWVLLDEGISIDRVSMRTELNGTISLNVCITNASRNTWHGYLDLNVTAENHDGYGTSGRIGLHMEPGTHTITQTLHVEDARLWWPWDQGDPNLYRLHAALVDTDQQIQSEWEEAFGFRTVTLERSPQRFIYHINERPVFIRGSSYMPGIYLSEVDEKSLERDLALARRANLNLLRVHVHVSRPELYTLCDRHGIMLWQDFELNWMHDPSLEFETRARQMQREMIDLLGNHPSIITWSSHNEPTMVFMRRQNLEQHPDPALYTDALEQDPSRPVFRCSGQMEDDWQHSGDTHSYYGALWTDNPTDVYGHTSRLSTEFGFEAPADPRTLRSSPYCWQRLKHLDNQIDALWAYQADLIQFHVEHFRRLRATSCAGYIHFWFADQVPQVGCGVLDSDRLPKSGYEALRRASQPLQVALEHDGRDARALWIFNDTIEQHNHCIIQWRAFSKNRSLLFEGKTPFSVRANESQRALMLNWPAASRQAAQIELTLLDGTGQMLAHNTYHYPLVRRHRPAGYPWKFDFELGTKVFDNEDAVSLVDLSTNRIFRFIPLTFREQIVEWSMRQRLPSRVVSSIANMLEILL